MKYVPSRYTSQRVFYSVSILVMSINDGIRPAWGGTGFNKDCNMLIIKYYVSWYCHCRVISDIYSTNFQEAYPKSEVMVASKVAPLVAGSTDIYATNFQKLYASRNTTSTGSATRAETGSTDIYFTNFQRRYM